MCEVSDAIERDTDLCVCVCVCSFVCVRFFVCVRVRTCFVVCGGATFKEFVNRL